jgi:GcrA cell cycle regulator
MSMIWTPEDTEKAVTRWKEGYAASLIAEELKVTRNAVIGKLHRMGLTNSDRPKETRIRKKSVYRPRQKTTKAAFTPAPDDPILITDPDRLHPFDAAIPKKQRRQTWELTSKMCKFPVGRPGASDFFHCGGKQLEGYVYCESHAARCLIPTQPIMLGGIR